MSARVLFMGTPEFAVPALRAILESGYDVPLVVTVPDRQQGRGLKVRASAVKEFALSQGLEVETPDSLRNPEFAARISAARPDIICVVAFRILPESIYTLSRLGSFNVHASLLPKYRGAAPINWAIINGERKSGVTTFFLRSKVDTGALILQRECEIGPEMDAGELHDLLMELGAEAAVATIRLIESGDVPRIEQDDSKASAAPKINREDCRIEWSSTAERVHDLIRGLAPYPGAYSLVKPGGEKDAGLRLTQLKIYSSRIVTDSEAVPIQLGKREIAVKAGELYIEPLRNGELIVATATTPLRILELQQEGKRRMTATEFLRGFNFAPGAVLG